MQTKQQAKKHQKNTNHQGSIYLGSDGKWHASIMITRNGRRVRKQFSGKDKASVEEKLNLFKDKVIEANKVTPSDFPESKAVVATKATLADEMYKWLETIKKHDLKPESFKRLYHTIHNQIVPHIGNLAVSELTVEIIDNELINEMRKQGLSYSSMKKVKSALKSFYQYYLIKNKLYYRPNIIDYIHLPTEAQKEVNWLTDKEAVKFCNACQRDGSTYADLLYVLLNTGLRVGEGIALEKRDYNPQIQMLYIRRNALPVSRVDVRKQKIGVQRMQIQEMPKTKSSYRIIPVNDSVSNVIEKHLREDNSDTDLIFKSQNNTLLWTYNVRRACDKLMQAAKLPKDKHGVHILRHTYATALFAQGVDIKTISYLLGHSGIQVTANTYVHIAEAFKYEKGVRKFKPYPDYLTI